EKTEIQVNVIPTNVQIRSAACCEINLGMVAIPIKYPKSMQLRVNAVPYFTKNGGSDNNCPYVPMISPAITSTATQKNMANEPRKRWGYWKMLLFFLTPTCSSTTSSLLTSTSGIFTTYTMTARMATPMAIPIYGLWILSESSTSKASCSAPV